jgi:hypothetical protein
MPYPFVVMRAAHYPPAASFVTTAPMTLSRCPVFKISGFQEQPSLKNNTWENP